MKKPEEMLLDAELEQTTQKLTDLQKQLDNLLKAGDAFVQDQPLPIQFFVRVNAGKLVESFSSLAKDTFNHVDQMKHAVEEKRKIAEAAKKAAVPEGQNNAGQ